MDEKISGPPAGSYLCKRGGCATETEKHRSYRQDLAQVCSCEDVSLNEVFGQVPT